jgi:hypothetical protein
VIAATARGPAAWYLIDMRLVLAALVVVAGCRVDNRRGGGGDDDAVVIDSGIRDGGVKLGFPCQLDSGCAEGVCAAGTHVCTDAALVRNVKATWTVRGAPASSTTCMTSPDLAIAFYRTQIDYVGFSPVPCVLGQYVITHLPFAYNEASLGRDGSSGSLHLPIPDGNEVMFDLDL